MWKDHCVFLITDLQAACTFRLECSTASLPFSMHVKAAKRPSLIRRKFHLLLLLAAVGGGRYASSLDNLLCVKCCRHAAGRHYSPVCRLEWVSREAGRSTGHAESLISCSMDGRITEWFTLKGFDCTGIVHPKLDSFLYLFLCCKTASV